MFRSRLAAVIAPIIAAALVTAACGRPPASGRGSDGQITVVVGFYPLAEVARAVGGDGVKVVNLTSAGAEAHDLELTPSQVDAVLDADLVVLLGGDFQPALEAAAERRDGRTLELGHDAAGDDSGEAGEDSGHDHGMAGDHGDNDPHVWLDPREFAEMAVHVGQAMGDLSPHLKAGTKARADEYAARLQRLDIEFEQGLKRCERRVFVTTHAAFGHLATAYDLRQESIAGLSPESEPDPERLAELADRIEELGVTTVFVEPLAPRGAAEALAREANVAIAELDPLESLRVGSRGDYFTVMRANLAALREALGCR